jgi:hypothetical protein
MPCHCEVDPARRLVVGRAWGIVTYDEIIAARNEFMNDPNFRPEFNQIYDGHEVTRLALTAFEVTKLAKDHSFGPSSRRAFIAPARETYRTMRLMQTYHELNGGREQIKLFRTRPEAEAWLAG